MSNNKPVVSIDEIKAYLDDLAENASQFYGRSDKEGDVAELFFDLPEMVKERQEVVRKKLLEAAKDDDEIPTIVKGDAVKLSVKQKGGNLKLHSDAPQATLDNYATARQRTTYTLDTAAVETYEQEKGELPEGIYRDDVVDSVQLTLL